MSFTLGSYTSFIRSDKKGIEFPYSEYGEHWIVAFVYSRPDEPAPASLYPFAQLQDVPPPFTQVEMFVRRKWEIAGDKAGSGNTANIGSRLATVQGLREGHPLFHDESEFLSYWRTYGRTKEERDATYSDLESFREWVVEGADEE